MRLSVKPTVFLIFFLALSVRVFNLNIPFLEPFNSVSRQSMCASVARNFYERGFHLFYPEIDENGSGPSLYNVEMPLYSYAMAVAYKLAGGVKEWAARSISVFFSMGMLVFLYLLVKRVAGRETAAWALAFAALSPMSVALSRSIQPDITMLFAATAALYFFYVYWQEDRAGAFVLSAIFLAFAVLTRIFALYLFIPIIYLAWEKEGTRLFKRPRNYAYAAFVALSLAWYVTMWRMGRSQVLFYEPYRYSPATGGAGFFEFFGPRYLALPAKAVFLHLLTPLGAILFLLGFTAKYPARARVFNVWFFATLFYLLLLWRTVVIHPYYFLPLVPPVAFFIGQGCVRIRTAGGMMKVFRHLVFLVAAVLFLSANLFYYYRLLYFVPLERMAVVEAGRAIEQLSPKDALVVASYGASPIQLYYSHRRGWTLDLEGVEDAALIDELEKLKQKNAAYYVTTQLPELDRKKDFRSYLSGHRLVKRTDRYVVYALREEGR